MRDNVFCEYIRIIRLAFKEYHGHLVEGREKFCIFGQRAARSKFFRLRLTDFNSQRILQTIL